LDGDGGAGARAAGPARAAIDQDAAPPPADARAPAALPRESALKPASVTTVLSYTFHSFTVLSFVDRSRRGPGGGRPAPAAAACGDRTQRTRLTFSSISSDFR
jgi:hypothetical protein